MLHVCRWHIDCIFQCLHSASFEVRPFFFDQDAGIVITIAGMHNNRLDDVGRDLPKCVSVYSYVRVHTYIHTYIHMCLHCSRTTAPGPSQKKSKYSSPYNLIRMHIYSQTYQHVRSETAAQGQSKQSREPSQDGHAGKVWPLCGRNARIKHTQDYGMWTRMCVCVCVCVYS
jgi:hypothetical protein